MLGIICCSSGIGITSFPTSHVTDIDQQSHSQRDVSNEINSLDDWVLSDNDDELPNLGQYLESYADKKESFDSYHKSSTSASTGLDLTYDAHEDVFTIYASIEDYGIATYSFDDGNYNALAVPSMELTTSYGQPVVPYSKLMLNIPDGNEVVNIQIRPVSSEKLLGLKLVPGPKPVAMYGDLTPDPTLFFDSEVYLADSFAPIDIVDSQIVNKGHEQALLLTLSPLQYNPVQKTGILNTEFVIDVQYSTPIVESEMIFQGWSDYDGANYTIITTDAFLPILTDFVSWKTSIGFDVQIETMDDILAGYSGRDAPEKVRSFISTAYSENNTGYFLLVGDCDIVPVREVWDPANASQGLDNFTEPTDFYYECLDGTWDDNGNDLFGEMDDDVDLFPEVKVGRLPVQYPSEAEHVLTQIISYENEPQDGTWMNDFMLIAVDCFGNGDGVVMAEGEVNQKYLYDSFYDVFRYYPTDGSLSNTNVLNKMNSGVGIVDFFDHGAYDGWYNTMDYQDALDLVNGNKSFFAFAMACETAAFDAEDVEPTIGEAFFRSALGGTHTYIGATRIAWAGEDCFDGFHNHFWDYFMEDALTNYEASPKQAFHDALNYMATTYDTGNGPTLEVLYQAIYFGDPALTMYWKHNVTTVTEVAEVDSTMEVNGTCLLYNNAPINDTIDVNITDPLGNSVFSDTVVTDVNGDFNISFTTSSVPGDYTILTHITSPFEYTETSSFNVGTLEVTLNLNTNPIYFTYLDYSGTVDEDCSGNATLLDSSGVPFATETFSSSSGLYSGSLNITEFGWLTLVIQFDNGTHTGGTSTMFQVVRGEVLVIADNSGDSGPDYPGGWADDNYGDASNPGDYVIALQDEYNVTVFYTMHEGAPTLSLLNQYDVVIVTTGDNEGNPLNASDAYLLDVLQEYHDSGGDIIFEGGSILTTLQTTEFDRFANLFHVSFAGSDSNDGSIELTHSGHPIMSGLPSAIPIDDGLGSEMVELFDPTNGSVHVAGYSGYSFSGIVALSPFASVGGIIFMGFSIDGIASSYRTVLIQNSVEYLLQPSLIVSVSDDAIQTSTSNTINVEVTDAATGTPIEGATVDFSGCGVSETNTSKADGTCSVYITPTSAGLIIVNVTKTGYLNYSTLITVYDLPVISLEASPEYLERSTLTRVTITATEYYEDTPINSCFVNVSGLGISETGYTNSSGMIDFDLFVEEAGIITIEGNLSGYLNSSIILPVQIHVLVLEGAGTEMADDCCWDELMLNWNNYGDYPLFIDYTTFQSSTTLSLSLLHSLSPDVISFGFPMDSYSTSEINIIKTYVEEGHGLVLGGGAMYYNPDDWEAYFGFSDLGTLEGAMATTALTIYDDSHPLFRDVSDPFIPGYPIAIYPQNTGWDSSRLSGATYLARENVSIPQNVISTYRGLVFYSAIHELESTTDDCQFLYNAFVWSNYSIPEHDLIASLDVPSSVSPYQSTTIEATVMNSGLEPETDVTLRLFIDDIEVDSLSIGTLAAGTSEILEYDWIPAFEGVYNVTASVDPTLDEETYVNNVVTNLVNVKDLHDYSMSEVAFSWLDAYENGLTLMGSGDDVSTAVTLPFDFSYYDGLFDTVYVSSNGWLSFDNTAPTTYSNIEYPSTSPSFQYALAPFWDDLVISDGIFLWSTSERVVVQYQNINYWGGGTAGTFQIVFNNDGTILFNYLQIYSIIDATVGLNHGDGIHFNSYDSSLLASATNFSLLFDYSLSGHDISVTLDAPDYAGQGILTDVTATVRNLRNSTETNIDLSISVDSIEIYSTIIPELNQFQVFEDTISWLPATPGIYNISVEVSPVPDEAFLGNNADYKMVTVETPRLLDITSPTTGATCEGGLVLVEFDTEELENISLFEVSVNNEDVISLSSMTVSEIMVPIFDNGTNEIEISAQWIDSRVASDSVSIQSTNVVNLLDPEPGDFYNWRIILDPYWEDMNYTFGSMTSIHEVEVDLHLELFDETNASMVSGGYTFTVNLLNGYISGSAMDGYHLFFLTGLRSPTYTGTQAEIGDAITMHLWTDNQQISSTSQWDGYAVWQLASIGTNESASVFRSNGILATYESEEAGQIGWVTNTSFFPAADTNPPEWATPFSDIIVEAGEDFTQQLPIYDETGVESFTVNDTTRFALTLAGVLSNRIDLPVGNYGLLLNATDPYGNSFIAQLTVISLDTTAPTFDMDTNYSQLSGSVFEVYLVVSDFSGIDHISLNDTRFSVNATGWFSSNDILEPGVYHVQVTAFDHYNNEASIVLTITIEAPTGPNEELSRIFMVVVFTGIVVVGLISCMQIRKEKAGRL